MGCETASKQVTKKDLTKLKPVQKTCIGKMRETIYSDQPHEVICYCTCIKFDIKKIKIFMVHRLIEI